MIAEDRSTMVEKNLGLVHSCAHRFRGRGIEYDDLFQAGCMGLVKATAAFDEARGVMFSTYAVPVILGEIRRLFRDGGAVKVSRSVKELGIKAARVKEQLGVVLGRDPALSEVAEAMERTPGEIAEALAASEDEIILCLNYDGLYGINNINRILQMANPNSPIQWGLQTFKVGDPILFNESGRFTI